MQTPLGLEPAYEDLNWAGLDFPKDRFAAVMAADRQRWVEELKSHDELFAKLAAKKPEALATERERLGQRLEA